MKGDSTSEIQPGVLYLAAEARQRLRLGEWAWRKLRRAGLRVIYQGGRAYVLGDDVIAFFANSKGGDES